jgi:hypothetical protein
MREEKLAVRDFFENCDPCGLLAWCTRSEWPNPQQFLKEFEVYGSNVFQFKLVMEHDVSDDLNCDEDQNTYDALRESEFDKIYFKLLHTIIFRTKYTYSFLASPIIEITPHWYEYLVNNGYVRRFLLCKNINSLMHELLLMCGDIESNPGPTYKQQCQQKWRKNKTSHKIEQLKEQQHIERVLRLQEQEYFDKDPIKRVKVEMQIMGSLASAVPLLSSVYLGCKTNRTMNKVTISADRITEEITSTLQRFKETFSKFEQFCYRGFNVIDLVADIMFSLLHLSFAKPGYKIATLSIELFRLLTKHAISTTLIDNLRNLISPYFNRKEVNMQIDIQDKLTGIATEITATHIVVFLFAILSVMFNSVIPKATQIESVIKRLGDLGRSSKGISDFNTVAHQAVGSVLGHFQENVLGIRKPEEIEKFVTGINLWFDEVRELMNREGEFKKSDAIMSDPAMILKVEDLYVRGMEFSKEIADKKLHRELQMPFQCHMKFITDLNKMVDTSGAFGTRPRTQPIVIWLYGESGVGKSGMSWPLAIDLNNLFVTNPEQAKEFSKHIYMRNVEQEFWDNYTRQNVVIYDDFGQRKDSSAKPNEEFMEIIRMANIAPYPLHMAHLEDKRKTRFTSKVVILSSNQFDQCINSLTHPDAFRRRIDLCGKVTNIEDFTKMGYSKANGKPVLRLDKDKVREATGEIISTSVYEIELIDPETGSTLETGLSYDEFLEKAVEKTRDCFDSSVELNTYLENYAERRFEQNKIRRTATMQIEVDQPKPTKIFNYGPLRDYTDAEILNWSESGNIVDKDGVVVDIAQIGMELTMEMADDFTLLDEHENITEAIWTQIRQNYFLRETKLYRQLLNLKKMANKKLIAWKENMCKMVKEHPFITAATVLMTISGIFMITKFWSKIMGKPKMEPKVKNEIKYANIEIRRYVDEEDVLDVRNIRYSDLMRYLPALIKDDLRPIVMNKPIPHVLAYLEGQDRKFEILVTDEIIEHHGKTIKMEIQEPINYGRQPDGGWKYPDNTFEIWQEMGSPRIMGFIPDYSCVPGFLPEASTSADAVTLQRPKPKVEVQNEMGLVELPEHRVEANVSGDAITMNKPKPRIEAIVSGDVRTLVKSKPRVEMAKEADMQMWKDQVAQNLITNRIFSNLYKISKLTGKNEGKPLLHGLFVRGNIMLVPGHLLGFMREGDEIELRNAFDVTFRLPWSSIEKITITNARGQAKEAALLVMPKYVSAHSDIVKHFSDGESMSMYRRADACIPVLRYFKKMERFLMSILGNHECKALDHVLYLDDREKGEYVLRAGLEYKCPTIDGDCGAPLIINETQVLRKIAGIHVAGSSDGCAYSESITQEDLLRALNKVEVSMQISVDFDNFCDIVRLDEVPLNELITVEDLKLKGFPGDKFNPVGRVPPIFEPSKTELRPSLVHGRISEIKTKPAILHSNIVNMKHKNLQKCAMDTPYIRKDLIDRAYNQTKQKWLKNRDKRLAKILTWEECVVGSDVSEYLGPIKRQSSPGYPWILQRKKNMKGKTGWFGDGEYILSSEVEEAVNYRIEEAKQGRRVPTVWVDTLKDERRPIEKVNALKTRVFSNGPMDFTLAFRKYYLGFVAHLMENRIENEVCIGTNVYSQDWKKLAKHLMKRGRKVVAGDFSNFDGTLNTLIMTKFADMANEFYNDGPENALIRQVLMTDVINSVHLCDGFIYMMTHSQPSGNPITTPLNCLVNSMGIRICFELIAEVIRENKTDTPQAILILEHVRKLMGERFEEFQAKFRMSMRDAENHLSIASYGDDDVINFSDQVSVWFNMTTLTLAFEMIGMTYTDESKTQGIAPDWKTLEEVSFLKRNFRWDNIKKVWEAPLAMDTILEMPNWCRGGLDIYEGTKVNCENAIMELSMHEEDVFDRWMPIIKEAFYDVTGDLLEIDTYRGYFQDRYMQYYL